MQKAELQTSSRQAISAEADYRAGINRALSFMQENLDQPLVLDDLARAGDFSPFHLHRIFQAFLGETPADYRQRLRMRNAADLLQSSSRTITEITIISGYEIPSAFTSAFRSWFGFSPSKMRRLKEMPDLGLAVLAPAAQPKRRCKIDPEIRNLPDLTIYSVMQTGMIGNSVDRTVDTAFQKLNVILMNHGLLKKVDYCLGISPDEPSSTDPKKFRYGAGYILKESVDLLSEEEMQVIVYPAGRYAVFTHKGPYSTLWQTWNAAYRDWLPSSGMRLRELEPFEVYRNDKAHTPPEKLVTEIFVPVE
ncbi:MAG TPA: AraC family transcriptional regulator [Anaerolineaceae bacterium]|nr:AraC family transcriptional regulator [Anaerolineaceae bacterium]HQP08088.1 AraC family transcriptional regulator [Anaerolineaceae bacterium]